VLPVIMQRNACVLRHDDGVISTTLKRGQPIHNNDGRVLSGAAGVSRWQGDKPRSYQGRR
jgi:hypothetical protein